MLSAGIEYCVASPEEAAERRVPGLQELQDPEGTPTELFYSSQVDVIAFGSGIYVLQCSSFRLAFGNRLGHRDIELGKRREAIQSLLLPICICSWRLLFHIVVVALDQITG